jgi:hypothetical protein
MESLGKDDETETNRNLLQLTVQKLPILRRKTPSKLSFANQDPNPETSSF